VVLITAQYQTTAPDELDLRSAMMAQPKGELLSKRRCCCVHNGAHRSIEVPSSECKGDQQHDDHDVKCDVSRTHHVVDAHTATAPGVIKISSPDMMENGHRLSSCVGALASHHSMMTDGTEDDAVKFC
jgi:hypothetical protein